MGRSSVANASNFSRRTAAKWSTARSVRKDTAGFFRRSIRLMLARATHLRPAEADGSFPGSVSNPIRRRFRIVGARRHWEGLLRLAEASGAEPTCKRRPRQDQEESK